MTLTQAPSPNRRSASRRGRQQQASAIVKLWVSSSTIARSAGTRWAVYNAVTEYRDDHQSVRGARTTRAAADTRACAP